MEFKVFEIVLNNTYKNDFMLNTTQKVTKVNMGRFKTVVLYKDAVVDEEGIFDTLKVNGS